MDAVADAERDTHAHGPAEDDAAATLAAEQMDRTVFHEMTRITDDRRLPPMARRYTTGTFAKAKNDKVTWKQLRQHKSS
jgi:hypothetical protein